MSFREFLPYEPADGNYYQQTLNEIIAFAAGKCQVGVDGESLAPEDYQRAVVDVNNVVLEFQTHGLHLSTYNVGYLFLQPDQFKYVVEDENSTNEYWDRALTADASETDTTLTVDDTSDLEVDDTIGIILDDNTLQWTTVDSFVADTSITIADALTGDAAEGNRIFNYRESLKQISRVHQIWRRENFVDDTPVEEIGQQEYDLLPNKSTSTGSASLIYYHRSIPKGTMYIWPVPDSSRTIIGFWYERKMGQMKDPTDIVDLDQFWAPAFNYTVALRLCDTFAVDPTIRQSIKEVQENLLEAALSYDADDTPVKISPNERV